MIIKILRLFYHFFMIPVSICRRFCRMLFNFILPNFCFILFKQINCNKYPLCIQKLYLTGLGKVSIGDYCTFGVKLGGFYRNGTIEFQVRYMNAEIHIGNNVWTNNNLFFCAANYIEIGDNTLIGQYVTIMDYEAHGIDVQNRRNVGVIGKVIVGKNVWIGNNVSILKNTEIGDNTIVATGAVVSGKFPSNVIIGGVPAKIIKSL